MLKQFLTLLQVLLGIFKFLLLPIKKPLHTMAFLSMFTCVMWSLGIPPQELPFWLNDNVGTRVKDFGNAITKHAINPAKDNVKGVLATATGQKIKGSQSSSIANLMQQKQQQDMQINAALVEMGYGNLAKQNAIASGTSPANNSYPAQTSYDIKTPSQLRAERKAFLKQQRINAIKNNPVAYSVEQFGNGSATFENSNTYNQESYQIASVSPENYEENTQTDEVRPFTSISGYPRAISGNKLLINTDLIRLYGIQVPRHSLKQAKSLITETIKSLPDEEIKASCDVYDYTRNNIPIAICQINGIEINSHLVQAGFASYIN